MANRYNDTSLFSALGGCGCLTLIFLCFYAPIVWFTDRNLDFWVSHFKGEVVDVPLWISCLLSLCEPILVLDIVGEIMRYFI